MESENDTLLPSDLLLPVFFDEKREEHPVDAGCRLDDVRHHVLLLLFIEVGERLATPLRCWRRSKSVRLAMPISSLHPMGKRYSTSAVRLA